MTHRVCALMLLVSSLAAQEVTFRSRAPKQGEVRVKESTDRDDTVFREFKDGKVIKSARNMNENASQKSETITASEGERVTAVKVTYGLVEIASVTTEKLDEKLEPERKKQAVSGKTYLLKETDGRVTVRDEKGAEIPDEEIKLVLKDYGKLIKPSPIGKIFENKTLKIGQKIEAPGREALKEFLNSTEVENATFDMTLKEMRTVNGYECGVLAGTIKFHAAGDIATNKPEVSLELAGEIAIGVETCWPVLVKLEGPIKFKTPAPSDYAEVTGTLTMRSEVKAK